MRIDHHILAFTALVICVEPVHAQERKACQGPGAAFGVTSFQCGSCEFKQEKNARAEYSFHAEPIVLRTSLTSVLRAGDIVETVNGWPITTRTGADQFAYPKPGPSVIRVRRNGSTVNLSATPADCDTGANQVSNEPGSTRRLWKGVISAYDSQIKPTAGDSGAGVAAAEPTSRFGFAIACTPACTRAKASDGTVYWKFDGYPPIIALREGGPAARVGIRVGDVVTEVDGLSLLQEDGALRFMRAETKESIHLTVLRDGKRIGYLVRGR